VLEHVQFADPVLAADLAALADASSADAPARREALRARLAAPPPQPLPVVLFLPLANRSFRAADLIHPDRIDRSLFDELGWRIATIVLVWVLTHHLLAGIRHLLSDIDIGSQLTAARRSAWIVNVGGIAMALLAAGALL